MRRVFKPLLFGLLISLSPVAALAAPSSASIEARAQNLRPGQFVWQPERSQDGEIEIVVSLPQQLAYVYRGETLIGVSTISSGQPGYETPTGTFNILQKDRHHRSNRYDDAPMPFMQRLTWSGVALHGGALPGHPASHGCIRLPMGFAQHLFAATELGAAVYVVDQAPGSAREALALGRSGEVYTGMGGPEEAAEGAPN